MRKTAMQFAMQMYADNAESEVTMPKTLEIMGYYKLEPYKYMNAPVSRNLCR